VLSGVPSRPGYYAIQVSVTDSKSYPKTLGYILEVVDILILPRELPLGRFGQPYSIQLNALSSAKPVTWSAVEPDCARFGLAVTESGVFAGIPRISGYATCGISATDAARRSVRSSVSIYVVPESGSVPVRLYGSAYGQASVGEFLRLDFGMDAVRPLTLHV